jgi:hypothetical protein
MVFNYDLDLLEIFYALTSWYSWNIAESGVKHNKSNLYWAKRFFNFHLCATQDRTLFSVSYVVVFSWCSGIWGYCSFCWYYYNCWPLNTTVTKWIKSKLNIINKIPNRWNKLFCMILNFGNIIFLLGITLQGKAVYIYWWLRLGPTWERKEDTQAEMKRSMFYSHSIVTYVSWPEL